MVGICLSLSVPRSVVGSSVPTVSDRRSAGRGRASGPGRWRASLAVRTPPAAFVRMCRCLLLHPFEDEAVVIPFVLELRWACRGISPAGVQRVAVAAEDGQGNSSFQWSIQIDKVS